MHFYLRTYLLTCFIAYLLTCLLSSVFTYLFNINPKSGLDKLRARCQSGALGHAKSLRRARFFGRAHFALQKRKNYIDLQIYSRISKTMRKLRWIPNTIVNTWVLVIFQCSYIWWHQNCFICTSVTLD